MADPVFVLHVPTDPTYRPIACEVATRYVDLVGGTEQERAAFEAVMSRAVDDLAKAGAQDVRVSCAVHGSGFEMTLTGGGKSAIIRHPVPSER